jgi:hypothetical protein
MVCGFCGTDVKPGFYTCPQCGAVYRKVGGLGCLGGIFIYVAAFIIALGVLPMLYGHVLFGLGLSGVGAGIVWMLNKSVKKRQTFQWVEGPRFRG